MAVEQLGEPPAAIEIRHKRSPLKALTFLRFLAAIHVVLFHRGFVSLMPSGALRNFLANGYTGVTFFFVLSGFILAYNYPVVTDRSSFWWARFARIYPVYLLSIVAIAGPFLFLHSESVGIFSARLLLCLFVLQSWFGSWAFSFNSPAWTLSVEAFFYAVFPFVPRPARRRIVLAGVLTGAAYLLFWLCPWIMERAHIGGTLPVALGSWLESPFPLVRLPAFLLGLFAGLLLLAEDQIGSGVRRASLITGILLVGMLLVCNPTGTLRPAHTATLAIGYVLLVFGAARLQWRFLTHPISQLAGEISYGIYILQFPVERLASRILPKLHLSGTGFDLAYIFLLIVLSYLSYYFFETPIRLWIRRRQA